jgi:SAM-dependent methyltransferase
MDGYTTPEWGAYQELSLHRVMLLDRVRTDAYRAAIERGVRPGDVVLDIGAGTGILSILAARAGASTVYAVERTRIHEFAQDLVEDNELEARVRVIHSDIESVTLPEPVDVIVSEWMGGIGVDENLLAPVLQARDRWLKPGGRMIPARVAGWLAPAHDREQDDEMRFWASGHYGVDLGLVADCTTQEHLWNRNVAPADLLAEPQRMWDLDAHSLPLAQAEKDFTARLTFVTRRPGRFNGLAAWFDADLGGVRLTNAPDAPDTHWGRFVFPLDDTVEVDAGTRIETEHSCDPAGPGYTHHRWAVRIGDGNWQYHDTRGAVI